LAASIGIQTESHFLSLIKNLMSAAATTYHHRLDIKSFNLYLRLLGGWMGDWWVGTAEGLHATKADWRPKRTWPESKVEPVLRSEIVGHSYLCHAGEF
jgi:hypothetical protein